MKTVKKSSWAYRLVLYTFERAPKSVCGFYWDLFLSLLISPLSAYGYFNEILLPLSEEEQVTNKIKREKASRLEYVGMPIIMTLVMWCASLFITLLFMSIVLWENPPAENRALVGLEGHLFLFGVPGMFIYPLVLAGSRKAYAHFKLKFCKPINFID